MRLRQIAATGLTTLAMIGVLGAGSAAAAPSNAKDSFSFQATCSNGQSYTVVVNGNGAFTPGHIIDGGGKNLIPVAIDLTGYDLDGNVLFTQQSVKNGQMTGRQDNLVTCQLNEPIPGEGTLTGTVTAAIAPGGQQ